jgi:hypothetical protein
LALPSLAHADPCEADLPTRAGQSFSGAVRYVGDGDSLCVGQSSDPNSWIEVRLADFNAPELNSQGGRPAKAALERIAMNRQAQCTAGGGRSSRVVSYDRVSALRASIPDAAQGISAPGHEPTRRPGRPRTRTFGARRGPPMIGPKRPQSENTGMAV